MNKKRSIIDYASITPELTKALWMQYPYGFEEKTIRFKNAKGEFISAIPIETETASYLIKINLRLEEELDVISNSDTTEDELKTDGINFTEADSANE